MEAERMASLRKDRAVVRKKTLASLEASEPSQSESQGHLTGEVGRSARAALRASRRVETEEASNPESAGGAGLSSAPPVAEEGPASQLGSGTHVRGGAEAEEEQEDGRRGVQGARGNRKGKRERGENVGEEAAREQRRVKRSRAEAPENNEDDGEGEEAEAEEGGGGDSMDSPDGEDAVAPVFRAPARGGDDFCPGNILSIHVRNFMTYSSITLQPSPRLNLIIGPNGTGKSSLVCAIGIGLAGEPRMLGRAGDVAEFVQRGKEAGMVRILLRGRAVEDRVLVERRINVQNRSEWFLNTRSAKREEVRDLMRSLNIQVENLTQFLPQDRVCEFAGLSKERLLEETLKAVGDPELSKQHAGLIQAKEDMKKRTDSVGALTTNLARLQRQNEEIERDVARLEQRQRLLAEAELMRKKAPWIRVKQLEDELAEVLAQGQELRTRRDELHARVMAAREPLGRAKGAKDGKVRELVELKRRADAAAAAVSGVAEKEEQLKARLAEIDVEIRQVHRDAKDREVKMQRIQVDLEKMRKELEEAPPLEPPTAQLRPLREELERMKKEVMEKDSAFANWDRQFIRARQSLDSAESRLRQVQSVRQRRIRMARDPGLEQACEWLEQHRRELRGVVYGPILTEVTVEDPAHCASLENKVPDWVWKAFITTVSADRDHLTKVMKGFGLTVINEDRPEDHFQVQEGLGVTEQMRRLGVTNRMDEVFSGPPVVRCTLIRQGALNHAFVGSALADRNVDAINAAGVRDLSTPTAKYAWRGSKYHSSISMTIGSIPPSRLFEQEGGLREEEAVRAEVEQRTLEAQRCHEERDRVGREKREVENRYAEIDKERERIVVQYRREKKRREDLREMIQRREEELARQQALGEGGARDREGALRREVGEVQEQRFLAAQAGHQALLRRCQLSMESAAVALAVEELSLVVRARDRAYKELESELVNLQVELDRREAVRRNAGVEIERAREAALREVDPDADAEIAELFESLPDDLEALEEAVVEKRREADRMLCSNPHLLEEYQGRKREIAALSNKLEGEADRLRELQGEMDRVKGLWLPKLRGLVERINHTFAANFREMAVAGEVLLDEHDNDFKSYGVRIRVQFRATAQMQDLSAHHQSGGERSVSTILYLVALQELSYCPFRVVDEINQGMDATNERKMFQQLVRATGKDNTPQCFLITPKLLPTLDYGQRCSIHTVMNGPYLDPLTKFAGLKDGSRLAKSVATLLGAAIS